MCGGGAACCGSSSIYEVPHRKIKFFEFDLQNQMKLFSKLDYCVVASCGDSWNSGLASDFQRKDAHFNQQLSLLSTLPWTQTCDQLLSTDSVFLSFHWTKLQTDLSFISWWAAANVLLADIQFTSQLRFNDHKSVQARLEMWKMELDLLPALKLHSSAQKEKKLMMTYVSALGFSLRGMFRCSCEAHRGLNMTQMLRREEAQDLSQKSACARVETPLASHRKETHVKAATAAPHHVPSLNGSTWTFAVSRWGCQTAASTNAAMQARLWSSVEPLLRLSGTTNIQKSSSNEKHTGFSSSSMIYSLIAV